MNQVALTPESLHARYAGKIDRHVRRVMGRDTEREDLVHEVLIAVFRKFESVRNHAALDAWVSQVTINTLKHTMRRRRVRNYMAWENLEHAPIAAQTGSLHARELASRAVDVLERLPDKHRTVLVAYWFSPATAESIAREARCSVTTARRRLSKAQAFFEKLARRDPALARCIEDARAGSRRWRHSPRATTPSWPLPVEVLAGEQPESRD